MHQLRIPELRERLRALWLEPHSLDPARHPAKVTREAAERLAVLARNLEHQYTAKAVAELLTRCIFTSFADNVELLRPNKPWLHMLQD